MSNDYFKAQGWFKNYALNSQDSRGVFQQLVKEDEEAFRLASAETDRIKDMINEKFGPGTMKPASELPPVQNPFDDFEDRNPMAGIEDETREYYLKYLEDRPEGSKGEPIPLKDFAPEFIRENAADGGQMVKPNADGSRPGYSGEYGPNIRKLSQSDSFEVSVVRGGKAGGKGGEKFYKTFNFSDYGSKENALKAAREYRESIPKIKKDTGKYSPGREIGFKKKTGGQAEIRTALNDLIKVGGKSFSNEDLRKLVDMDLFPNDDQFRKAVNAVKKEPEFKNLTFEKKPRPRLKTDPVSVLQDATAKRRGKKINILGSKDYEKELYKYKKEIQEALGLEKYKTSGSISGKPRELLPIEMGHQSSIKQLYLLKQKMRPEDLNPQNYEVNRKGVRKNKGGVQTLENNLNKKFYPEQKKLYIQAKKFIDAGKNVPADLQNKIITLNEDIQKFVDKTVEKYPLLKDRVNPITIDANDLTVKRGNNVFKQLGIGLVDQDLGDIKIGSMDDLTIKANLAEQTFKEAVDAGLIDEVEGRKKLDKFLNARPIDYIDGKGGTTLSSGFNTDLLMKDKTIQKIVNSKAGKAVANGLKNAARSGAGAVGKVFGIADIVLGVLDLENNLSKGESFKVAAKNAIQAASINTWKIGDKAKIEEIKERFVAKGGDGEIFDQATDLNAKDQEINDLIYAKKRHADKVATQFGENPDFGFNSTIEDKKEYYNTLKKESNEEIAKAISERDNMIRSYKTNLQVSEAGAPINIGGQEFFGKPFRDIKAETMDRIAEENKFSYPMQKRQVYFTSGKYGNFVQNNIFTMNPQEKAEFQRQINNMDERELYKFNLSRGMDPDNLIRFEDVLRYKERYPELMGGNTTKYINRADRKAEGGITGLRSKYEYKK